MLFPLPTIIRFKATIWFVGRDRVFQRIQPRHEVLVDLIILEQGARRFVLSATPVGKAPPPPKKKIVKRTKKR